MVSSEAIEEYVKVDRRVGSVAEGVGSDVLGSGVGGGAICGKAAPAGRGERGEEAEREEARGTVVVMEVDGREVGDADAGVTVAVFPLVVRFVALVLENENAVGRSLPADTG